jgi:hypothetical protein
VQLGGIYLVLGEGWEESIYSVLEATCHASTEPVLLEAGCEVSVYTVLEAGCVAFILSVFKV